jgi:hypothetical protein
VLLLCKPLARGELEAALRRLLADGVKQGAAGASVALAG